MPADVLEVTKKFMREPIRILVKKEELTLEGIKQFYINVEREVCVGDLTITPMADRTRSLHASTPFFLKHPAETATVQALMPSSCGRVSMGTPRKESRRTGSTLPWEDLFLNVPYPLAKDAVQHTVLRQLFSSVYLACNQFKTA